VIIDKTRMDYLSHHISRCLPYMGIVRETFYHSKEATRDLLGYFFKNRLFPYRIIRIYSGVLLDGLNRQDLVRTFPAHGKIRKDCPMNAALSDFQSKL